jgi:hypothetical protein
MPATLPPALRTRLQKAAAQKLREALDALSHAKKSEKPQQLAAQSLLKQSFSAMSTRAARDAFWFLRRGDTQEFEDVWEELLARYDELLDQLLQTDTRSSEWRRRGRLVSLTAATAVMIPLLARRGKAREAVALADAHRRMIMSESNQKVAGAGGITLKTENDQGETKVEEIPAVRFILLSPVLWSLAGHYRFDQKGRKRHEQRE